MVTHHDPAVLDEVKRLKAMHISVPDIMRQTVLSMFEVYEVTESREVAIKKMARLNYVRGTGWPWDEIVVHPDDQRNPTGDKALDSARAIVNLFRGRALDDPIRQALYTLPLEERRQMVEIITELVRQAGK
ncbi:hypothetical protein [Pseudorhizobium flavum]|uniref:hypothetical protein n=1 Tax=Pseudorhizobium flavum TaxID=1335061 RepID=UPI0037703A73